MTLGVDLFPLHNKKSKSRVLNRVMDRVFYCCKKQQLICLHTELSLPNEFTDIF